MRNRLCFTKLFFVQRERLFWRHRASFWRLRANTSSGCEHYMCLEFFGKNRSCKCESLSVAVAVVIAVAVAIAIAVAVAIAISKTWSTVTWPIH